MNLDAAMAMEAQYRTLSGEQKRDFGYHTKLRDFGFESTVDYERAKDIRHIGEINWLEIGASQFIPSLREHIESDKEGIWIVNPEQLLVWSGTAPLNTDYCAENGIPIYEVKYSGGTIVTGVEDVAIGVLVHNERIRYTFSTMLYEVVAGHCHAEQDGNDIIVAGKKVSGVGSARFGNLYLGTYQMTFVHHASEIAAICGQSHKNVGGLFELCCMEKGDLVEVVKSWLK